MHIIHAIVPYLKWDNAPARSGKPNLTLGKQSSGDGIDYGVSMTEMDIASFLAVESSPPSPIVKISFGQQQATPPSPPVPMANPVLNSINEADSDEQFEPLMESQLGSTPSFSAAVRPASIIIAGLMLG